MRNRMPAVLLAAAIAAVVPSCKGASEDGSPVVRGADFVDVPVPLNFSQVAEKSNVVQNPAFRSGTLVYTGSLQTSILRDWYKGAMASKGWAPLPAASPEPAHPPYLLSFEKGREKCDVCIDAPATDTIVTLTLGLK